MCRSRGESKGVMELVIKGKGLKKVVNPDFAQFISISTVEATGCDYFDGFPDDARRRHVWFLRKLQFYVFCCYFDTIL